MSLSTQLCMKKFEDNMRNAGFKYKAHTLYQITKSPYFTDTLLMAEKLSEAFEVIVKYYKEKCPNDNFISFNYVNGEILIVNGDKEKPIDLEYNIK